MPPLSARWSRRALLALAVWSAVPWVCLGQRKQVPPDPKRFEPAIAAFEAADKSHPPPRNATLFVGASNIRRWTSLPSDFRNPRVINRGFGGAYLRDVVHFADRIIFPYEPSAVVLQAGGNDLNGGRTPAEVLEDLQTLVTRLHDRLPSTSLTVLSIPPSEARWAQIDAIRSANQLMNDYLATDPQTAFIDLFPHMLTPEGLPRSELFVEDRLHLNAQGYELWGSLIRWDKEIKALVAADRQHPPEPGGIVFVGSSSIRRWTTLASDFPDLPVINHGFGGSQILDAVVFADQIVLPLKPRMVVFYAGGNDINAGKKPDRIVRDFQAFVRKVHSRLPETRIAFISIAGNPARWPQVEVVKEANRRVEEYTRGDPRLAFINVFPHMLGPDGLPLPDIFVADRLHMNAKGYEIWKTRVRPFLEPSTVP